jgi:hypothetical protein
MRDQLALEIQNFVIGTLPLLRAREALDALDQDPAVPAAIVDSPCSRASRVNRASAPCCFSRAAA